MADANVLPASSPDSIRLAGAIIRLGGLVAFPTETVYGLGCDAMNPDAVAKVFDVKQRPRFDPLIVHLDDRSMLSTIVKSIPPAAQRLMEVFWPGPLTLILPKQPNVPDLVTAGLPTVAVRMPDHPVAQALIRESRTPIAAPSANPFGYVSPTTAQHVHAGLGDRLDLILDGGPCSIGVESTILSFAGPLPEIVRPGSLSLENIQAIIGPVVHAPSADKEGQAPGQSARHYATSTPVTILPAQGAWPAHQDHERVGLLAMSTPRHSTGRFRAVEVLAPSGDLREAAHRLFAALRRLDELCLDHLYIEPCQEEGLGLAIMDRLRRCAAPARP
ncbi:MAG: L-threonylcarbamoyladenylate synthase [Nitrospira sp.]|nr:L-threonylcarbamoyladenylate synthase [Nitrospira sp.]